MNDLATHVLALYSRREELMLEMFQAARNGDWESVMRLDEEESAMTAIINSLPDTPDKLDIETIRSCARIERRIEEIDAELETLVYQYLYNLLPHQLLRTPAECH